jgi:hypothetical protein
MTRRQSNNHWIGGIAAHHAPNYSECKNPLENFSTRFFGLKTASSSLIIFQRVKLSTRSITYLCWCNWRTFWRKNIAGSPPRRSCSCTTMPRFTGHLQHPQKTGLPGLPTSWSPTLFSGSCTIGLPSVPWTEKTIELWPFFVHPGLKRQLKGSHFFVRRGGYSCRGNLVGRRRFWFFLSVLQNLEQRTKSVLNFVGIMLNKSRVSL